ncbi:MAG: NINE protein [Cyanobacteriota bacterium]
MSRSRPPGAPGALPPGSGQERRSVALSYGLWCLSLIGICGIHRIYNRKPLSGLLWLISFGLCGVGQLVDLLLIPTMVEAANHNAGLGRTPRSPDSVSPGVARVDRQLLRLARASGEKGFTINDALLELDLPPQMDSIALHGEIEKLLLAELLDVGNDERGRVIYREP